MFFFQHFFSHKAADIDLLTSFEVIVSMISKKCFCFLNILKITDSTFFSFYLKLVVSYNPFVFQNGDELYF